MISGRGSFHFGGRVVEIGAELDQGAILWDEMWD